MKLLSVNLARSIWLFNTEDVNPRGLDLVPVFVAIQGRYRFRRYPTKPDEFYMSPNGIQFGGGTFRLDDNEQIEVASFTVYNDGLVADTRTSTAATDNFLRDLLTFVATNHRLAVDPQVVRKKQYLSQLVVTTGARLEQVCEKLGSFARILSESIESSYPFHPISVRFGTDPGGHRVQLGFIFERRVGTPFEHKRYFSEAPVETDQHLQLLNRLEEMMAG